MLGLNLSTERLANLDSRDFSRLHKSHQLTKKLADHDDEGEAKKQKSKLNLTSKENDPIS